MATSHALKELAVFLTVVFVLRSFHPPDTENTQLSIHRTDMIALYASSMTSKADYEVFVPNSKSYAKTKMAEIPRTKQVRILLKYLKLTLMAELNVSLCLLACGDISSNPGPTNTNQTGNDTFKLPAKGLRLGQWNVNYLTKTKFDEIKLHVLNLDGRKNLDILVITETFFSNKTPEDLYNLPGFDLLRKDRQSGSGGGIVVYINNELKFSHRTDLEELDLEVLWFEVCPFKSKRPLLMAGVYRSPSLKAEYDHRLAENINHACLLNMETILLGDMNLDYLQKEFNSHRLVKELRDSNFKQLVSSATRPISKSCLDHIWSNKPDRIVNIKCPDICISDHLPVLAVRLYKHCSPDKTKNHKYITYRNLNCLNQEKFVKALHETPWDTIFVFDEVDDIVHGWYSLLNEAIDANAPIKRKRIRDDTKPKWLSPAILKLMKKRDHLLKKAKRTNAPDDWSALKSAKNKVTKAIKAAKKNFFYESFRENENNPNKIWSALKDLSGKHSTRGVTYLEENKTTRIEDDVSIAEVFNKHFTGLAAKLVDKTATQFNSKTLKSFVSKRNTPDVKHAFPTITANQTKNLIEAIPSGKATGMDGVSARILRIAAPAIAPSLAKLINICIAHGTFPTAWKEAKVTPIHKQNSKSDKNNYRPISVLPVLSKIFERHLHNSLSAFLKDSNLLYSLQSAFRKYHSTDVFYDYKRELPGLY